MKLRLQPPPAVLLQGALLLGLYALVRPRFFRHVRLPEAACFEPSIAIQALFTPKIAAPWRSACCRCCGRVGCAGPPSTAEARCASWSASRRCCWPGPSRPWT